MRYWKASFATLVVLAGFSTSASAQGFAVGGAQGNGFGFGGNQGFGFGGNGFNSGFGGAGFNSGFGGGFNNFGGYSGIGSNTYGYSPYIYRPIPQTTNNMFGLMNSIQTQTGGGNSYRRGYAAGSRRR